MKQHIKQFLENFVYAIIIIVFTFAVMSEPSWIMILSSLSMLLVCTQIKTNMDIINLNNKYVKTMVKKKYKYMHTIDGKPAEFYGEQIVYAGKWVNSLCDSLKQIREEQKKSKQFRISKDWESFGYGYVKVVIQ